MGRGAGRWTLPIGIGTGGVLLALASMPAAGAPPAFDGERALALARELCAFGPRVPGTKAHAQARAYLTTHLTAQGAVVTREDFMAQSPLTPSVTQFSNVVARFRPGVEPRVLLGAHWDSRPHADADPDSARRREPVLGANDAASACAVLLHLAELLGREAPPLGVDLVFFDAEDGGLPTQPETYCLGSREHVRRMTGPHPAYVIVLDMVGGRDLNLPVEGYSRAQAPAIVQLVWGRAAELGHPEFVLETGAAVFDDHLPFLAAGIPAIDLIDFKYPEWHTTRDTFDRLSARSLELVGEVVTSVLYEP
jgi:Zn-dependent M28 family amino/carboxypeptidase